jgi:hypothetical protein
MAATRARPIATGSATGFAPDLRADFVPVGAGLAVAALVNAAPSRGRRR